MSFPYPQDRHRDRREKGDIEYVEARQAMAGAEEAQVAEAEYFGEQLAADEENTTDLEANLEAAARDVHRSLAEEEDDARA